MTLLFLPDPLRISLAETDRRWRYITAGRTYHGEAINPKSLSIFEWAVLRLHKVTLPHHSAMLPVYVCVPSVSVYVYMVCNTAAAESGIGERGVSLGQCSEVGVCMQLVARMLLYYCITCCCSCERVQTAACICACSPLLLYVWTAVYVQHETDRLTFDSHRTTTASWMLKSHSMI